MSDSLRPHGLQPTRLLCPRNFPCKSAGVGCHFLLQGIFPTQGPGFWHCRQTLYCLSHQGSPKLSPNCQASICSLVLSHPHQRFGAMDIKALGASQLSGLRQTVLQLLDKSVLQLYFIQKIAGESILKALGHVNPKTRREESGRACQNAGERKKAHAQGAGLGGGGGKREGGRERESTRVLWLLLLYVFSSPWACPMQIGLSQECCLFYLRSSPWSSDLPLFYFCRLSPSLSFSHLHFGLFFLFQLCNVTIYKTFPRG